MSKGAVTAAEFADLGDKLWVYDNDGLPVIVSAPASVDFAAVRVAVMYDGAVSPHAVDYREVSPTASLYHVVTRYSREFTDVTASNVSRRNYACAAVEYREGTHDVHPSVPGLLSLLKPQVRPFRHLMSDADVAILAAVSVYGSIDPGAIPVAVEAVGTASPSGWLGPVSIVSRLCALGVPVCQYRRCSFLSVATAMYAGAVCWYLQTRGVSKRLPMPATVVDAFCDSDAVVSFVSGRVTAACPAVMEPLLGAISALGADPVPVSVLQWYLSAAMPWRYAFGVSGTNFLSFDDSVPITDNRFGFPSASSWDTFYAAHVAVLPDTFSDPTPALIKAFTPAPPPISTKTTKLSMPPFNSPLLATPPQQAGIAAAAGGLCNE
jgi:hypothetical protein